MKEKSKEEFPHSNFAYEKTIKLLGAGSLQQTYSITGFNKVSEAFSQTLLHGLDTFELDTTTTDIIIATIIISPTSGKYSFVRNGKIVFSRIDDVVNLLNGEKLDDGRLCITGILNSHPDVVNSGMYFTLDLIRNSIMPFKDDAPFIEKIKVFNSYYRVYISSDCLRTVIMRCKRQAIEVIRNSPNEVIAKAYDL